MSSVLDDIAVETGGKSFKTFKYEFDGIEMPRFDYDDHQQRFTWKRYGETEKHQSVIPLRKRAEQLMDSVPIFCYFLDGSRKTYKVDDMSYNNHVYPVLAGQVGVGCCLRREGKMTSLKYRRHLVISLPEVAKISDWDEDDLSFDYLRRKLNTRADLQKRGIDFAKIVPYSVEVGKGNRIENKGIATIQNYMADQEKALVAELVKEGYLLPGQFLLKDGSLEYQVHNISNTNELARFRNNYQFVVGASKSFNPANCVDKSGRNNSNLVAELPLYFRTPVQMYSSDVIGDMTFAVWFVRIREHRYTNNAFDGILKLEMILVTEQQMEHGLESDDVDIITASIINERNPVCYGADRRWANHLYPIYVTESYVKSQYLGESMFLSLF